MLHRIHQTLPHLSISIPNGHVKSQSCLVELVGFEEAGGFRRRPYPQKGPDVVAAAFAIAVLRH